MATSLNEHDPSTSTDPLRLHDILMPQQIEELRQIFKNAPEQKLTREMLRALFDDYLITINDKDFETLFLKMNTNRDDHCDWNEFVSHLIFGFMTDDPYSQKETLSLPIEDKPIVRKSLHKFLIVRIRFCPIVLPDRSVNNLTGNFITASKDGTLIWWNQNFEYQRSGKSKNIFLRVAKTEILDFICMPDVRIICTSSIEYDLRFYDVTASNFQLRIVISNLPFAVQKMNYWFADSTDEQCKIVLGDRAGNVTLIEFNSELRGPFQSKPGTLLMEITWKQFVKGELPGLSITNSSKAHEDIVRQVEYCESLNSIVSAAECRDMRVGSKPKPGLVITELGVQKHKTILYMTKGVTCFAYDPISEIFATGGPDCILRLWNHIVPKKPIAILPGHHSGIVYVFIQDGGKKIYSIDREKTIKIWDAIEQQIEQTYIQIITTMPERSAITHFYHDPNRELILAGMRILAVKCCPLLKLDKTDGYTHSRQVSVVLYNDLFQSIVTCGLDSYVIVWDPWTGKRITLIKGAHTRLFHGEIQRVEITAACFDPKKQLLLTGARDGTLKMWNFNNGVCVRNFAIEHMCEVTAVFWFHERILAMGWNKHVTEFSETSEHGHGGIGKYWDTCHLEDILVAAARESETLATGSYSGELVLWKLETGQPYRRYSVDNPTARVKIVYEGDKVALPTESKYKRSRAHNLKFLRRSYMQTIADDPLLDSPHPTRKTPNKIPLLEDIKAGRRVSIVQLPTRSAIRQFVSIHSMVFLRARPMLPEFGTLCLSLDHGLMQVYSHHNQGGFIDSFNASHLAGDCVVSCATDRENRYLFTGTVLGYVKTWLVKNYCVPDEKKVKINMAQLNLEFPFLWRDRWQGRAKRTVCHRKNPLLCNSYKGHVQSVTDLIYLDDTKLVISSSSDFTVRIWTLSGQYIGTLGSPVGWEHLSPNNPVPDEYNFRIPPDIQRVASSTTLKVLKGGNVTDPLAYLIARSKRPKQPEKEVCSVEHLTTYGDPITEPMLGKNLKIPDVEPVRTVKKLDKSLRYYPVYGHLEYEPADIVKTPSTPKLLKKCRDIAFMADDNLSE